VEYTWDPFDFPVCNGTNALINEYIPLFNRITKIKKSTDVINYDNQYATRPSSGQSSSQNDRLFVGNTIDAPTPFDNGLVPDTLLQVNTNMQTEFEYIAASGDPFQSGDIISRAYLEFSYAGNYMNECMMLKIEADKFNIVERIVIGCPALQLLPDTIAYTQPTETPKVQIPLTNFLDSLTAMDVGEKVKFTISSLTIGGQIEILNISDDQLPHIIAVTYTCDPHQDYTTHIDYNDTLRTTTSSSKIDDELHTTSLGWTKTYSSKDGRYTGGKQYYGSLNRALRSDLYIGSPASPTRTDSVVSYYDGNYQVIHSKDQLGYLDTLIYDRDGRIVYGYFTDGTYKQTVYELLNDNPGGQDFYGSILRVRTAYELSLIHI